VIAGGLWSAAGAALILRAVGWLLEMGPGRGVLYGSMGALLAIPAYRFGMVRIARKNLRRISTLPDRPCLFAFTAWKGYLVIGTMVTGGILLRNSTLPKELLALLYSCMGGALILGSTQFFRTFLDSPRERSHEQ
jgi:hypothetical protein